MQLSKFTVAIIVAALSFATAAPAGGEVENSAEARDIIYLGQAGYAWEHSNQAGRRWSLTTFGGCTRLFNSVENDKISSMQINEGIECKFYKNLLCRRKMPFGQGGEVTRKGPWTGNVPSGWHDVISSYNCERV